MPQWHAPKTTAELTGMTVKALTTTIMHDDIANLLRRHNLEEIDPQAWYPAQDLANLFEEISRAANASPTFVSLGMAAAEIGIAALPAPLKELPLDVLLSKYDDIWQSRHRNGEIGHIRFEKVNDNHMILRYNAIYPDDIFYGVFYAYVRHFRPRNMGFSVAYDDTLPRQDDGGSESVIHILLTPQ